MAFCRSVSSRWKVSIIFSSLSLSCLNTRASWSRDTWEGLLTAAAAAAAAAGAGAPPILTSCLCSGWVGAGVCESLFRLGKRGGVWVIFECFSTTSGLVRGTENVMYDSSQRVFQFCFEKSHSFSLTHILFMFQSLSLLFMLQLIAVCVSSTLAIGWSALLNRSVRLP